MHCSRSPGRHRLIPLVAAVALLIMSPSVIPATPAAAAPPVDPAGFQQVTLAKGVAEVGEPMSLAVLPDRSVLHTARDGTVRMARRSGRCHQPQSRASALVRGPGRRVAAGVVTAVDNRGGAVAASWRSGVLGR
ncbi:hypothetical protein ACWDOR_29170 [Streptosporangium canum]|uniref:hypothetical protein n=1 Tax=Streptosporangium canum TaxID=324952 RepID=UPI00378DEB7B